MNNETKGIIDELKRKISDLEKKVSFHKHTGYDNSSMIEGHLKLKSESFLTIGETYQTGMNFFKGTSKEMNRHFLATGIDNTLGYGKTTKNTQLTLENQPATTGGTNQSFYYGFRPPLWVETGISITSGTNTFTDSAKNWTTNSLVNAYVNLYDSTGAFKEVRKISSNTATVVTVDTNFTFTDASSIYIILVPIYLGAADYPWRRIYTMEDIRFGRGLSGGTDVIWIKFGSGSPEGAITANIGSLYLRTNGGANTTLYVKESGAGNTGWIAK